MNPSTPSTGAPSIGPTGLGRNFGLKWGSNSGEEHENGDGISPIHLGGVGSVVSSRSRVRGGAPADNGLV